MPTSADLKIQYGFPPSHEDDSELTELREALADGLDTTPRVERAAAPDAKDGGLTIGIAIAGLALKAIKLGLDLVKQWADARPKYTVKIAVGDATVEGRNLDEATVTRVLNQQSGPVRVLIQKRS
jgi:hypothetical protein